MAKQKKEELSEEVKLMIENRGCSIETAKLAVAIGEMDHVDLAEELLRLRKRQEGSFLSPSPRRRKK